jgi:hypothetical protein
MHRTSERSALAALVLAISLLLMSPPAKAVEDGLFGVRIGASYRQLLVEFGTPDGIMFPSGSGMVFQTTSPVGGGAGLPDFSQQAQTAEIPVYVLPIRASTLEANQVQWTYDLRQSGGIALGIVLNGEGADAIVSDVIVAGFPKYLRGKREPVRTAKGIVLQSTFEDVLRQYGYPTLIEIYPPATSAGGARAGAGGAMRAGGGRGGMRGGMRAGGARGGMRGGMRGGGARGGRGMGGGMRGGRRGGMRGGRRGGMRGGRAEAPDPGATRLAQVGGDGFELVLTGAPGMRGGRRGGMRGGGMRGGGMRGGGARGGIGGRRGMRGGRAGRGTLPPLGTAATPEEQFTATAVVDHQAVTFSRSCLMIYEGIAFTLHDMKVYRIHVSE